MTKRMLIDANQPEETRVVVVNNNKLEDVECETAHRRQIKGNIYLGKIMRVEPSLQACFVDYGGNKHGFMAFGEIHPDYYNLSAEDMAALDKEVDDIIENKKQSLKDRELERERVRKQKAAAREEAMARKAETAKQAPQAPAEQTEQTASEVEPENTDAVEPTEEDSADKKHRTKKRLLKKRIRKHTDTETSEEPLKVMTEATGLREDSISEEVEEEKSTSFGTSEMYDVDDDDDEAEMDFELQRKLMKARKLFHRSKIQDVIKEGQIVLIQIVKEERGNKGAALTTYLSLAGRYCVLMPNRIKSGGVSRKITNAADRNRLKGIVKELPLTSDMSIIVRTAGEEKSKADIVRDYNYLIHTWNNIRIGSLKDKAPALIHEEGNLIKRALRDIYTKDVSEIIVSGEEAYKSAKDFFKILSPNNLKKIKNYRNTDMPMFQRFQVEGQLDKLHEVTAQLESGGYLVINPTEALISIDVNSGRATKEKDLEETALKTNLEACDEVARQLRMRNLAGLVVIDFIDMEEPSNNHAVEKRMKEALKKDRSRIQVGKMSIFGLLELSRQRMHSSFFESNYQTCPHCQGKGIIRTTESSASFILRMIEEEGIKNRSSRVDIFVPADIAIYLLNQKRQMLAALEAKYKMSVMIGADSTINCIADYRIERTKAIKEEEAPRQKQVAQEEREDRPREDRPRDNRPRDDRARDNRVRDDKPRAATPTEAPKPAPQEQAAVAETTEATAETQAQDERRQGQGRDNNNRRRRNRFDRRRNRFDRRENGAENANLEAQPRREKQEAVLLYNSHGDHTSARTETSADGDSSKEKSTWWKKLIKG